MMPNAPGHKQQPGSGEIFVLNSSIALIPALGISDITWGNDVTGPLAIFLEDGLLGSV
jgi:hypothetical protein